MMKTCETIKDKVSVGIWNANASTMAAASSPSEKERRCKEKDSPTTIKRDKGDTKSPSRGSCAYSAVVDERRGCLPFSWRRRWGVFVRGLFFLAPKISLRPSFIRLMTSSELHDPGLFLVAQKRLAAENAPTSDRLSLGFIRHPQSLGRFRQKQYRTKHCTPTRRTYREIILYTV
eukprot:scaffold7808_cov184-Amphora_coffeaeformis.AAC.27